MTDHGKRFTLICHMMENENKHGNPAKNKFGRQYD
jgi:hypothetical protein